MSNDNDREEFAAYLRGLTDSQVLGAYEKEKAAHRQGYARLAREEAERRNIWYAAP